MTPSIIAAGGVVWRRDIEGEVEVLLVHRPRYDDWSLPKGKLEDGEALISCAYREVLEETGLSIKLGPYVGSVEYYVPDGLKNVAYWSASLVDDNSAFHPNEEVDQIIWLDLQSAAFKATRDSDRYILERFGATPFDSSALIMLRHAKALERTEWQGPSSCCAMLKLWSVPSGRVRTKIDHFRSWDNSKQSECCRSIKFLG